MSQQPTLWLEGMFIEPQHFQQMEMHVKTQFNANLSAIVPHVFGILTLKWQQSLIKTQKLALEEVSAIFQDGYFVDSTAGDLLPEPIEIPRECKNQWVYLSLPVINKNKKNIAHSAESDSARFIMLSQNTPDFNASERHAEIIVGQANIKLSLEPHPQYLNLKIAKIKSVTEEGHILLDRNAMPAWLNINHNPIIQSFYNELLNLLQYRISSLQKNIGEKQAYHLQAITDFVAISCMLRYQTKIRHLQSRTTLHPEKLYLLLSELYAELCLLTSSEAKEIKAYDHLDQSYFVILINNIREKLTESSREKLNALNLTPFEHSCLKAVIPNPDFIKAGTFILAAHSTLPLDALKEKLNLIKVAAPQNIENLIKLQLPGFKLKNLAHPPVPIPYYRDYLYYEIEMDDPQPVIESASLVIHVPAFLSDVGFQLWFFHDEEHAK